jgi:hypothetical protein
MNSSLDACSTDTKSKIFEPVKNRKYEILEEWKKKEFNFGSMHM